MNIKAIVQRYLVKNRFDGLCLVKDGEAVCCCPSCDPMQCVESCYKPTECVPGHEIIDEDGDHVIRPGRKP